MAVLALLLLAAGDRGVFRRAARRARRPAKTVAVARRRDCAALTGAGARDDAASGAAAVGQRDPVRVARAGLVVGAAPYPAVRVVGKGAVLGMGRDRGEQRAGGNRKRGD